MAGTIVEKIFSKHVGKKVSAGTTVIASVDVVMATDGSGPLTIDLFKKMHGKSVFDKSKVIMIMDHYVPCPNDKVSRLHDSMRQFEKDGFCTLEDLGEGICHQLMPEKGYVKPGSLIVGGDSHSTTYGAFNALGTGVGSSDLAAAMISGKLWFRVPETIKIALTGKLKKNVYAKDLALLLMQQIGVRGAIYKAIEFSGTGLASLAISQRMTLCNMLVETGAKCVLMPFDKRTQSYFKKAKVDFCNPDKNASYEKIININLNNVVPMIAKPHQVDNVVEIKEMIGTPIQMGVLGTCTNGRIDDLQAALDVMGNKNVAKGFELLVIPASRKIYVKAAEKGILAKFTQKGALVLPPGCGPCCGSSPGIPSDGENIISTANRNFIGRMGNVKANIYLASPSSVALAAVKGKIAILED